MIGLALWLARKDFLRDWRAFLGQSFAMAAILAPLIILLALKNGAIDAMMRPLETNPDTRQINFLGNYTLTAEIFAQLEALPGVGFVALLPRSMGQSVELVAGDFRTTNVTLRSSGPGDPYLAGSPAPQLRQIILTERSAGEIAARPGDPVTVVLRNPATGETFDVAVSVSGISPLLPGRFALVHPDLAFAAEAVASAEAVPGLGIPGRPPSGDALDGGRVRIFADSLSSVAPLVETLERLGYVVDSEAATIDTIVLLDRRLSLLLVVIAALSGAGFTLSFVASTLVSIRRKRKSLAMLRLMGAPAAAVAVFPVVQAVGVVTIGLAVAFIGYACAVPLLNAVFSGGLVGGGSGLDVAALPLGQAGLIVAGALGLAIVVGVIGGWVITRLEPKEAMRDA